MTWRGVVWREAGAYGPLGGFVPQKDLGTWTFDNPPEVGMILEVGDEEYQVVSVGLGFCHVRPRTMKARR